eukprot:1053391-Alexandrium_andersonii.AAC.1
MSASLVGSEMCIRDSHMYGAAINTLTVKADGGTIFTKTGQQGNAWKTACLLYTSDAADDM